MTKYIDKLTVRIVIGVVLGLLLASRTTIQAPCSTSPPDEDITKCVAYPDAIEQPSKLLDNEQDSLVRFTTTFAVTTMTSFAVLSAYSWHITRKLNKFS